nr:hypothetical protein [Streptomyces chryseus]
MRLRAAFAPVLRALAAPGAGGPREPLARHRALLVRALGDGPDEEVAADERAPPLSRDAV